VIQRRKLCFTVALAVLLGCAGGESTKAQEKPAPDAKSDDKDKGEKSDKGKAAEREKAEKEKEDKRVYKAVVTDRSPETSQKDYAISNAEIWVPEVSIFGGEGHTAEKKLSVKRGAAEINVPFTEIAWVSFGELKEDRLVVEVKRIVDVKTDKVLSGTIKSNLLLHGTYENTNLEAKLKLREVSKIVLEAQEQK
jgi:hypothetical protein